MGIYRGSDSTGLEIRYPFNAACFSPCLPNPNPANLESFSFSLVPFCGVDDASLDPVYRFDTNDGGLERTDDARGPILTGPTCVGIALFACSRQDVMDRLTLADSRKIRPAKTFKQPIAKRKKAETSVNVLTWCERTAAPILRRKKRVKHIAHTKGRNSVRERRLTAFG